MDSFNWLDFIDSFHMQNNLTDKPVPATCSYRVSSYLFESFRHGSFGSFDSFDFFGSFGSFTEFNFVKLHDEPLNLFGYGIDLI